jgi:hypothetical protein
MDKNLAKKISMRQLAKMSLNERHQYLAPYIPKIAEDFLNDPELTEFCVLDAEDWEIVVNSETCTTQQQSPHP